MGRSLPLAIVHKMLSKRNRRPANRRRSRQVEPLEPRIVLDSTAVFNELMYHPRAEDGLEWIELHNQQGVDFDISGWQLDGGVEYTFPEGTIMDGGGYLVISANPSLSGIPGALGPFTGSLANGGEEVLLLNNSGRILDRIDYGDNTPWPVGADGSGVTLAKKSPNLGTEDVNNWTVSAQVGGTPGGLNFIGNTLVFTTEDLITPGDTAEVHVPTDASLGTDWTDPAYVLGTHGESWSVLSSSSGYVDGAMNQSYQDIVLADSPLAYWRLSESAPGSPAVNLGTLGAAANGTYAANVNLGGDSLVREAGDTSLGIPKNLGAIAVSSPEFEKVNTGRTMEFWVGVDELPTIAMDVVGDAQVGITFGMYITLQPTGYLRVTERTNINFVGISQVQIEQPLEEGETYHVVVTRTESTGELHAYINGQSVAITSVSGAMPNTGASVNTNNPIFIGNSARSTSGNAALRMDEVAIYNYPLSAVRASSHYDGGRVQFNQLFQSEISGMVNSSSSAYLRSTFSVPQNVDYSSLTLNINYDDGFVAYLNGVEVARRNISGSPGFDSTADSSRTLGEASTTESIPLGDYLNLLEPTGNVLAVHGVNVDAADEDFMVSYGLSAFGVEKPVVLDVPIRLSEVSSAMATDFSIELENPTDSAVDVTGVRIVSDGDIVDEYVLPSTSIPAHGFLSLTQADLGFRPADGDRLFVYNPAGTQLIDARVVTNRLRGLSPEHDNRWLYPSLATPGAANVFDINSDIVINEIFYNAPIRRAEPAVVEKFEVVPFDLEWRYNASDQNLGSGWQNNTYAVNNTTWFSGAGPIGYTNVELPVPLGTSIGVQGIFERTYYFQTEFTFDGNPTGLDLTLTSLIDDGAVIYLNGQEIQRIRMPDGPIDGTTAATESPTTSDFDDPITLPDELFVVGQNTLSVEVHRGPFLSPVVVMGLEIAAVEVVTPAQPQTDPDEQWIELYNRGTEAVDISNWAFADGVSFDVPAGTIVQPGEYVVVANDEVELAAKYPEVRILGEFSGNISRSGDRLELVDAANNPVDTVDFKDGGRWDGLADSGGSSLELKDPFADNSIPEAWQASDGSDNGEWQTITYRGRATTSNAPTTYNELVLGLLDSGEVLLDDIQVTQDPDGTARQLIQNGTFESDTVGMPASTWRIIGTHEESHVVVDPDDSSNQVLKLVATGPTEHMHNHAETTLKDGANYVSINSSLTYEISFRAKWLSGSDQLHSRLYFNRLPLTSHLARSENWGTPGLANSTAVDNIGPTYSNLLHGPTVPAENQDIRISVNADDPDGIQQMLVYYAVDGGAFSTVSMTTSGNGEYVGVIPGQPAESIIQFYVEGTDSRGAVSTFPAAGPDSRALIQVQDDAAGNLGSHNFRIVMTTTDSDRLHLNTNVMSNARIGATVIYDESEIYYDVGVRLKGSERGR
ncbi:MAG: lamin tail domain-containing protein, partial [Planctomycetales bacterium]|nr:lamin tail domain-containing protein [Planctomycetales bacterium]